MPVLSPDFLGAAPATALGRVQAQQAQEPDDRIGRDLAEKGDVQEIAIVEERRGLGDRPFGLGRREAVDEQGFGGDADAERAAGRRLADGLGHPLDRGADRRVFRRVERPVSGRDEQRPRDP